MSKLLVTVFLILLAQAFAISRITEQVKEQCRQQTHLSLEDSRVLKANEILSAKKKCYIKCLFSKGGYIEDDGTLLVQKMKTDNIADGDTARLNKIYSCVSSLDRLITCEKITELIDCFTL